MNRLEYDRLWGTVRRTLENMREASPEGFIARVQVRLLDGEAIEPAGAGLLDSWLYFEIEEEGDQTTTAHRVIFVRPEHIAHVELKYVRGEREIGFRVSEPRLAVVLDSD
jgi:hypothetical protein